ncbi:MAG TPA: P-loop NTPase fold protein, partial [Opitutaceae bacterium]|nr:P-loop NTPase fold protein [Opitutaceae bacterium]
MTTPLSDHHRADEPLEHPRDDTLGRTPFAERIARELAASGGHERFVVSLNGDGGSGKTTLKNFIRHFIAEGGKPGRLASPWFDFNPWEWTGQASLEQAFVEQIGVQLALHSDPVVRGLTDAWQKWGAALASPGAGRSITPLVREKREALCTLLRALPFPIIVCVDDVDRLAPADVRELAQLVTTRAALPNFTCFLLFETQPVVAALADASGCGSDLLHKVVQLEIEMPDAPEALLRQQLERGLAAILAPVTFPARPRERWNDVLASAVWPLFSTPRDVKRFLASFAFQFAGYFRAPLGVLEVNPIDLVLVEALRMFAHPVFVELRDTFRRRETRLVRLMSGRDEERKEARVEIDRVVEDSTFPARKKRVLTTLLQHLVPPGTGGGHGCREDWERDLRLCSPRHVERYFHLGAIPDAVPASRLIELVRSAGDRVKMEALLLQSARDGVLPEVLDRLPAVLDPVPENHLPLASAALCGICDQIPKEAPADLEGRLVRFAGELFARMKNAMKREDVMAALLEDPERLTGPILLL